MTDQRPHDHPALGPADHPGLPNERTALAWRRTALSLLVAATTMAKVSTETGRLGALLWLVVGVPGALVVLVTSSVTYRARRVDHHSVGTWWQVGSAAATTAVLGVLCLLHVLLRPRG